MSPEIIVAIITGVVTIFTVVINSALSQREMNAKLDKSQAVMQTKLDELTREVRMHNDYVTRVPLCERDIKVINHRLDDLEKREG